MYKYVCAVQYYPNCRGHEAGYYHSLQFFKTFKDVLNYAIKEIAENELMWLHTIEGHCKGRFIYEISGHSCSGIIFENTDGEHKLRTMDDGKGNLIWKEM